MEDIRKHMICQGYKGDRVYFSQSPEPLFYRDGTPVAQEVKEKMIMDKDDATKLATKFIKNGQLIVAQTGHGGSEGWKKPPLRFEDLKTLSSDRLCVFFNISCETGRFQFGSQDNYFAEKRTRRHKVAIGSKWRLVFLLWRAHHWLR